MTQIDETRLPGIGIRYAFETGEGVSLGVVHHRSGRRELFIGDGEDPDCVAAAVNLTEQEGHVLADVLGGSTVTQHIGDLAHHIEGLTIEWLTLGAGAPLDGATIVERRVHTHTGAYIVAIVRHGEAIPAPDPTIRLAAGDVVVAVGTVEAVGALERLVTPSE
jgi:TrkA domain protein